MPSVVPVLALIATLLATANSPLIAQSVGATTPSTRGLVIVLRPGDIDSLTRTALARVAGELAAARFQVIVLPLDPNVDPTQQVETAGPESSPVAAFAIAHTSPNTDTVAIWVCDRLGRRTTIQRMAMRGGDISQDAEVLALEAIELIRASIAGLWPPPPARHAPTEPATTAGPPPHRRFPLSVGVGLAMLQDIGLASPQWMGSLTGMVPWTGRLTVRGQLNGLGPALTLSGNYGTAVIHRELGSFGLAWTFWSGERVHSFFSAAVGVEHLSADGSAADPTRAHPRTAWSALGALGIGAAARLGDEVTFFAELDGIATAPPLVLRIANTDTKPFSRPGVLVNVGLQTTF
jgi:hypothetical protein